MSILYCDCFSGISGDMFLAAMLDAGLPPEHLDGQFRRLNLEEYQGLAGRKVQRGSLSATLLELDIREGNASGETPGHAHAHHHPHGQDHGPVHAHHHERNLEEISRLIDSSSLADPVKKTSTRIFQRLAEAEARVHGQPVAEVHFHEVGAVDSILDIVGAAVALEYFQVRSVYASALPMGSGQVHTRHGLVPLPAPATLELLRMAQAPVTSSPATVELVTPTGAAILAALAEFRQPGMTVQTVGVGAGRRELEWPNILRLVLGQPAEGEGTHLEIETNIDDMNPQVLGHVMSRLFQEGALDVYFTPIYMKKNRPAVRLSVIAQRKDEDALCSLLLQETSTLGVRVMPVQRHEAGREVRSVETRYGLVPVKLKILDGRIVQAMPEFDPCARLSEQNGVPVRDILQEALAACRDLIAPAG